MNILVVTQYYYPEPFRINEICEELVRRKNNVSVITTFPNYPEGKIYKGYRNRKYLKEDVNGVTVFRYKTYPRKTGLFSLMFNYLSFSVRISNKIKQHYKDEYDVIYCYQTSPVLQAIPAIKAKKRLGIPLYLYCLDLWPESVKDNIPNENNLIYIILKKISSYIYQMADRIGVTSKSFTKYLVNVCGVQNDKISFIPQHAEDMNCEHCVKQDDIVEMFYMGNMGESQNIEMLIHAAEQLRNERKFRLNLVGTGSKAEKCRKLVQEKKLEDKVIFHGKHPASEMRYFYEKADVCLLSLSNKTLVGNTIPGKLQSYMSAGKPIIAAINGEAKNVIEDAKCGIVVPADDVKALVGAIKEYINNIHSYKDCGENARRYFEQHYTLEKHIEMLVKDLGKEII